ncbi:hypothetical protein TWF225_003833 [Orbilia oligospora]|uniref:Apple domain-containing protein n=1 Tax=Orbilia oligospora TaxID=2813651 RepID=A0A8H2DPX9_ORBOL|nr:hypothetical protein TWF225_003833 [Orbilia oligospora]KAF3248556.1 hypothetical protein TWF128_008280 [Orbilia oligospora]KAF3258604.1 hypothetical protein TWF217_005379 [Orbilia oligospora]KAF3295471.1 hypothetical protein TWF132_001518 [Orbilia oligospora]TGJ64540.1 hypothetical protein EYR41_010588 [Orbilia oligospora]
MVFLPLLPFFLLILPALAASLEKRQCTGNNCLRALRASRRIAQASLDCSIFFDSSVIIVSTATTTFVSVIPTEVTTTTVYSIINRPTTRNKDKRDPEPIVPPKARHVPTPIALVPRQEASSTDIELPAYATACRGPSAFASACSCIGVEQPTGTITVTDTTTSTITGQTRTRTTTVTVPACDPSQNHGIAYSGGGAVPGPGVSGSDYNFQQLLNVTDSASCCRRCFETVGCFTYDLVASYCRINFLVAGSSETPTDTGLCPYGRLIEFTDPGSAFGLGPCNSYGGPAS